jgi:hypothetical protein
VSADRGERYLQAWATFIVDAYRKATKGEGIVDDRR